MADSRLTRLLRRLGRRASPLFDPDAEVRVAREKATRRALEELAESIATLESSVKRVGARVDKIDRAQAGELRQAVHALRTAQRQQVTFSDRLLRRSHPQMQREFIRERVLRRLRALRNPKRPIIVGPWTGEVGFELLYWVPFVRWAVQEFRLDPARMVIMSRGGTEAWYGLPEARYVDVLTRRTPAALKERMATAKKQRTVRLFDRQLIREMSTELGATPGFLHPSLMYVLFMPYWKQMVSLRWVEQFASAGRITPPDVPQLTLPETFVAVRFYFSDCFPDTDANRAVVRSVVAATARDHEVVLLGSGVSVDEHRDAEVAGVAGRIHTVDHLMRPDTNLAVQTAVIARASSFIGTYGGFSYLAPLLGVDTVALYSLNNFYEHHLDFAQQMFSAVGGGSLTVVDTSVRDMVGRLAGAEAAR